MSSVDNDIRLLKSNVSGQEKQVYQVAVNTIKRIVFSAVHPSKGVFEMMIKKKKEKLEQ